MVKLKCSGDVTITSSATVAIDISSIGAAASTNGQGTTVYPTTGSGVHSYGDARGAVGGTGGTGGLANPTIFGKILTFSTGAGGENGGSSYGPFGMGAGAGGRGGGGLLIECKGALNFGASATIKTNGANGSQGSSGGSGGGGGGGGTIIILYNTLTANSGTIVATGGSGANGGNGTGGAGGTGLSLGTSTGNGGNGSVPSHTDYGGGGGGGGGNGGNNGSNASSTGAGGTGAGGGGGGGCWMIVKNTEFA